MIVYCKKCKLVYYIEDDKVKQKSNGLVIWHCSCGNKEFDVIGL